MDAVPVGVGEGVGLGLGVGVGVGVGEGVGLGLGDGLGDGCGAGLLLAAVLVALQPAKTVKANPRVAITMKRGNGILVRVIEAPFASGVTHCDVAAVAEVRCPQEQLAISRVAADLTDRPRKAPAEPSLIRREGECLVFPLDPDAGVFRAIIDSYHDDYPTSILG